MAQTHINEVPSMADLIVTQLTGDALLMDDATAVTRGVAPLGTVPPFVTFFYAPAPDVMGIGASRAFARGLWDIVAWVPVAQPGMIAAQRRIANRIDAVLHGLINQVTAEALILGVDRLEPIAQDDDPMADGTIWSRLGGRYEVYAQPLTGA